MPITTISNYGKHENVLILEFGTGDIQFNRAANPGEPFDSKLIFSHTEPHEIGAETDEYKGMSSDELPNVKMVMEFTKPESITALIHSLIEIQKDIFRAQNAAK